jgi:pimeloyl-ACP methyl ester carboxylesterase
VSETVLEAGPPRAPTIVLLHGGGLGAWSWRPCLELLSTDWHCLAPRLPGHGADASRPFTFDRAIALVQELIASRATGGVAHVVGLSLGGQLALAVAAGRPALVDRLVVTGANVRGIPGARAILWWTRPFLGLKNLAWVGRLSARQLHVAPDDLAAFLADTRAVTYQSLSAIVLQSAEFRTPPALARFDRPVLVLAGAKEVQLIQRSAADLGAVIPNSTVRVVPGQDHVWPLDDPRLFSDTVRAWCSDRPLPSPLMDGSRGPGQRRMP